MFIRPIKNSYRDLSKKEVLPSFFRWLSFADMDLGIFFFVKRFKSPSLLWVLFLILFQSPTFALESKSIVSPRAHVTVVSSMDFIEAGKPFYIGLRFRLAKGWHIYWSNPGDAGQAPAFSLKATSGLKNSGILWPTPTRLKEGPAMVYAYLGDITLPIKVTALPSLNEKALKLGIDADWLVCEEHCVPEKGHFDLSIPLGVEKTSSQSPLIEASLSRVPRPAPFEIYVTDKATLLIKNKGISSPVVQDAWFLPEQWGMIEHAAAQKLVLGKEGFSLELKPGPLFKVKTPLPGILVLKDSGNHEIYYQVTASPEIITGGWQGWIHQIVFALLGGLILNLMPCVFPVLAIKALSIIQLSKSERRHVKEQAFFYTLGVLVAFTVIALILLGLRTAGETVGWGFQFQSPLFVTFMAWLLFVIGLNLSGVFIFGAHIMGIGEKYADKKGVAGSFFTGLLAVVVATPCVAPFLGAAIATALSASALGMLLIFWAMALGLALPYMLLTLYPEAVRVLPRPGAWMEVLKQGLAFPMYAASAWMLWVLSRQDGSQGLAYALGGIILLGLVMWLYGQVPVRHAVARNLKNGMLLAGLLVVAVLYGGVIKLPASAANVPAHLAMNEEPFTEERLSQLQAAEMPIFVDMTAAWCITCLVNERVAIASDAVQNVFARDHIVYLKGDWTQQDPAISRFLKQHDSEGVPLYVYYPPHHKDPIVLPQILTPSIVLSAVNPL